MIETQITLNYLRLINQGTIPEEYLNRPSPTDIGRLSQCSCRDLLLSFQLSFSSRFFDHCSRLFTLPCLSSAEKRETINCSRIPSPVRIAYPLPCGSIWPSKTRLQAVFSPLITCSSEVWPAMGNFRFPAYQARVSYFCHWMIVTISAEDNCARIFAPCSLGNSGIR